MRLQTTCCAQWQLCEGARGQGRLALGLEQPPSAAAKPRGGVTGRQPRHAAVPSPCSYYLDPKQAPPGGPDLEVAEEGEQAAAAAAAARRAPPRQLDAEELLAEAEAAAGDAGAELLDARGLKRLVLALERKHKANMALRRHGGAGRGAPRASQPPAPPPGSRPCRQPPCSPSLPVFRSKYADQPDRFLESEVDLDEAVKAMLVGGRAGGAPFLWGWWIKGGDHARGRRPEPCCWGQAGGWAGSGSGARPPQPSQPATPALSVALCQPGGKRSSPAPTHTQVVASSPELYPDLVASSALPTLLALLNHENRWGGSAAGGAEVAGRDACYYPNPHCHAHAYSPLPSPRFFFSRSDIVADVIELISELTDADAVEDAVRGSGWVWWWWCGFFFRGAHLHPLTAAAAVAVTPLRCSAGAEAWWPLIESLPAPPGLQPCVPSCPPPSPPSPPPKKINK